MHHGLSHIQEDGLEVFLVSDGFTELGEVHGTGKRNEDSADDGKTHPGDAVETALLGVGRLTQRHEAHDNVRLTKVAKAPSGVTNDNTSGNTGEEREVVIVWLESPVGSVAVFGSEGEDRAGIVKSEKRHDWHDQQGDEHQHALHSVGVGHCQEATDEGVENGHCGDDQHTGDVVATEGGLEVTTTGDHAGRDVEGKEEDNDNCGDNTQHARLIAQTVLEEGGDRNGIARNLRVSAQTRRNPLPVCPCTDKEADRHPQLGKTGKEERARQTHKQPAGHIGCAGGESSYEWVQATAAQNIIVIFVGLFVAPVANGCHYEEVHNHRNDVPS